VGNNENSASKLCLQRGTVTSLFDIRLWFGSLVQGEPLPYRKSRATAVCPIRHSVRQVLETKTERCIFIVLKLFSPQWNAIYEGESHT
jgi:hypothetical protein